MMAKLVLINGDVIKAREGCKFAWNAEKNALEHISGTLEHAKTGAEMRFKTVRKPYLTNKKD